jgi:hypothetical protein
VTTAAASALPAELLAEIRDSSKLEEAHTSAEVGTRALAPLVQYF